MDAIKNTKHVANGTHELQNKMARERKEYYTVTYIVPMCEAFIESI